MLSLARAAASASLDPAIGSQMSEVMFGRKIRAKFITSDVKPKKACTTTDVLALDGRRWEGRSAEACGKMWVRMRRECTRFNGCFRRIETLEMTGNPTVHDLERCALFEYNSGEQKQGHLYDCINNESYPVGKPFVFMSAFRYLSANTQLVSGDAELEAKTENRSIPPRPMGNKKAKLEAAKVARGEAKQDPVEAVAASMVRMEKTMAKKNDMRHAVEMKKIDLEHQKLLWDQAMVLFGPGSTASVDERGRVQDLMRKRVMADLERNAAGDADKSCTDS